MGEQIKVVMLGTASHIPTPMRNHTGIFINYKSENILVDCGENIQKQFRVACLNPCKLTKILITHWHGDHVFGLPGLLSTLNLSGYSKVLEIYGPIGIKKNILKMCELYNFKKNFEFVIKEIAGGVFYENDDFYLESQEMEHGIPCNAYSFVLKESLRIKKDKIRNKEVFNFENLKKLKQGKSFSYKGKKFDYKEYTFLEKSKKISLVLDTQDNPRIVSFVKNADLFISECSYNSLYIDKATEHKHMTAIQVGKIAKRAGVKKLVLTHLSSRFDKSFDDVLLEAKKHFENVFVAKDFDKFCL